MPRVILSGGILYTGSDVYSPASLVIEGDSVVQILSAKEAQEFTPAEGDTRIDAAGRLITPGLINAHTHLYSTLARGLALKDPPPSTFLQILERLWWRLDAALDFEAIDLSARLGAVECLHAGVTTIFDHHASQRAVRGSLDVVARALSDCGLRACLSFEVSDRMGPDAARAGVEENRRFLEETAAGGGHLRRALFGLHASFTLSDETLASCADAAAAPGGADGAGFHIHVAEDRCDAEITRRRDGRGLIERLQTFGILGPRTICVHGVHLDDAAIDLLGASRSWLVHCPQSNLNNAVGAVSLSRWRRAGVRLALGTDGFTADIKREALVAHLLQNHVSGSSQAGARELPLFWEANAALAAGIFGLDLGRIRTGGPADLVVWDYQPPTPLRAENFWGHFLFGLVNARALEVFVAGNRVLRQGEITFGSEAELRRRSSLAAEALWRRF